MGKKKKKPLSIPPENPKLKLKGSSRTIHIEDINVSRDVIMGDQYNFGNITGSIIDVSSSLERTTQSINATNIDEQVKKQLLELLEQLNVELQKTPPTKREDVEVVAGCVKALIEAGIQTHPNKTIVQITAEGLEKAAEDIASVMPTVLIIVSSIVKTVYQLARIP